MIAGEYLALISDTLTVENNEHNFPVSCVCMCVQGFRVTINRMGPGSHHWLVIEGGGRSFGFTNFNPLRRLKNGQLGIAILTIAASRFEIFSSSELNKGFDISYESFLGIYSEYRLFYFTFILDLTSLY